MTSRDSRQQIGITVTVNHCLYLCFSKWKLIFAGATTLT